MSALGAQCQTCAQLEGPEGKVNALAAFAVASGLTSCAYCAAGRAPNQARKEPCLVCATGKVSTGQACVACVGSTQPNAIGSHCVRRLHLQRPPAHIFPVCVGRTRTDQVGGYLFVAIGWKL